MLRAAIRTASMADAATMLGVPASAGELVGRMQRIDEEPAAPAREVYSGVLYDALGPRVEPGADGVQAIITSALFGIVDCHRDLIPAYRLSAKSTVSRLGTVASWWKKHLAPVGQRLVNDHSVVVDARSGAYKAMMPLRGEHVVALAPVVERGGARTVVSHNAKRYRGIVARELLAHGPVGSIDELTAVLESRLEGQLSLELTRAKSGSTLTLVDRPDAA